MKQWPNTRKRSHWMKIAASLLGRLYAKIGRRDEALAVLERLRQNSEERYVSPYNFLLSMSDLAERTKRSIFSNKPTRMGTDTTSRSRNRSVPRSHAQGSPGLKRWSKKFLPRDDQGSNNFFTEPKNICS